MKFGLGYWGRLSSPVRRRKGWPSLTIVAMVATGLSSVVIAAGVATAPPASAGTPPAPPSGWTTTFSDSFSGAAGSGAELQQLVLRHRYWLRHRRDRADDLVHGQLQPGRQRRPETHRHRVRRQLDVLPAREHARQLLCTARRGDGNGGLDRAAQPTEWRRPRLLAGVLVPWLARARRRELAHGG